MAKRSKRSKAHVAHPAPGNVAHAAQGTLRSYQVGALPILNHFLQRMKLPDAVGAAIGPDDPRAKLSTTTTLLVLLRNLLVSREPVYGAYVDAATEKRFLGQPTLAITFGHNKDHRPDP